MRVSPKKQAAFAQPCSLRPPALRPSFGGHAEELQTRLLSGGEGTGKTGAEPSRSTRRMPRWVAIHEDATHEVFDATPCCRCRLTPSGLAFGFWLAGQADSICTFHKGHHGIHERKGGIVVDPLHPD